MNHVAICRKSARKEKSNPEKHLNSDSCMRTSLILTSLYGKKKKSVNKNRSLQLCNWPVWWHAVCV